MTFNYRAILLHQYYFPIENMPLINASSSMPAGKCGLLVRSLLTICNWWNWHICVQGRMLQLVKAWHVHHTLLPLSEFHPPQCIWVPQGIPGWSRSWQTCDEVSCLMRHLERASHQRSWRSRLCPVLLLQIQDRWEWSCLPLNLAYGVWFFLNICEEWKAQK